MTPAELKAWRRRLGLNQIQAAEALGISRAQLQRYEAGDWPITRTVQLACIGLEYLRLKQV